VGGATLSACSARSATGRRWRPSGLTGGTRVETSVYPFIVRNVALLGIDTVLTPVGERRVVWGELARWVAG